MTTFQAKPHRFCIFLFQKSFTFPQQRFQDEADLHGNCRDGKNKVRLCYRPSTRFATLQNNHRESDNCIHKFMSSVSDIQFGICVYEFFSAWPNSRSVSAPEGSGCATCWCKVRLPEVWTLPQTETCCTTHNIVVVKKDCVSWKILNVMSQKKKRWGGQSARSHACLWEFKTLNWGCQI